MSGGAVEDQTTSAALEKWCWWNWEVTGAVLDETDVAASVSVIVDNHIGVEKWIWGTSIHDLLDAGRTIGSKAIGFRG